MDFCQLIETVSEVSPDDTFPAILGLMSERHAKVAAVIQDGKVLGIITGAGIARHITELLERDTSVLRARDMMTAPVERMPASTPLIDAVHTMRSRRIPYLALIDERGDFVGIVTLPRMLCEAMDELDLKVNDLERELMADGPGG
jgi:CBS domain-containing protein